MSIFLFSGLLAWSRIVFRPSINTTKFSKIYISWGHPLCHYMQLYWCLCISGNCCHSTEASFRSSTFVIWRSWPVQYKSDTSHIANLSSVDSDSTWVDHSRPSDLTELSCRKELTNLKGHTPPLNRAQVEKKCLTPIYMALFMSDQPNLEYVKMKMIPWAPETDFRD